MRMVMPENGHCKHRIQAAYSSLRAKEKEIADYILEHPEKIVHSTISEVAETLKMAEATVFRFCKKLGFKGYQAMKIALASETVTGMANIHETIQEGDNQETITEKVFKSNILALEETFSIVNSTHFKSAVEMILNARRLEIYGNGGSGSVALDAHHKFMRIGIPTTSYSDSHLQVISASQLTEEDVVILISHSGTNRDILQTLEVVKETGAKTIGITTLAKSAFSQAVDIPLFTVAQETYFRSEALSSRIAQLTLLDALYVNVSTAKEETTNEALVKMRKAIALKRI